jgi:hypothetical protein
MLKSQFAKSASFPKVSTQEILAVVIAEPQVAEHGTNSEICQWNFS